MALHDKESIAPFEIGRLISVLYRTGYAYFTHKTADHDLSGVQIGLIFHLYKHDGVSQDELTKALEVDKATVTRSLNKLETCGIIERKRDIDDQRVNRILLTAHGHALRHDLKRVAKEWQDTLLKGFSEQEIEVLASMFNKLTDNARAFRETL
ncbi:MAG TPA: hypothetical protein DCS67_10985 [Clostridiales bacterium UBA8960]|nr:hypothetical protein [Clostridiales bacterium UBA8960]